ncbi:MAG: FecR domain-containing protein [Deltaproteobacteria bacterium]|nr:FecR domain-containing protein [Deltaproteobacteria bacterium]
MKIVRIMVLSAALILGNITLCLAEPECIGIVKSVARNVIFIRKGETIPAAVNMKMMVNDVVRTGPDGAIGFILKDDTVISMGPGSELVIDDFSFDPVEKKMSFIARMLHGTISYVSGQIVKLSPESVHFETPVATIGMRGTHFLVKAGDN